VTADRPGSRGLANAPAAVAKPNDQSPGLVTRVAETITRFGLPAFILCLPLEFTSLFLPLQLARIVLLIVGVAFAYLVLTRRRTLVLPLSTSGAVLGLFAVASLASWISTRSPGSTNLVGDLVAYSLMAVLVVNLARTEDEVRRAWAALLLSALAIALLGAVLYYTHSSIWRPDPDHLGRVNATFADPNISARFFNLAICTAILMYAARRQPTWLSVGTVVACAAIFPLTFSKSGYFILVVTVVMIVPMALDRRRAAALAAVALVIFVAAIAINTDTRDRANIVWHSLTQSAQNVSQQQNVSQPTSATGQGLAGVELDPVRTYLIQAGWQMFRDHPLTGVGFGGFQHALLTTYKSFLPANPPATLSHTSAITILSEQGLIGGLLFLAFLALLLREVVDSLVRRTPWRLWIVIPAVLIAPILAYSQFEGRLIEEPYLWLALGLFYAARTLENPSRTFPLVA
jgi:putative inorganic carbon (hco3(-)) transporter